MANYLLVLSPRLSLVKLRLVFMCDLSSARIPDRELYHRTFSCPDRSQTNLQQYKHGCKRRGGSGPLYIFGTRKIYPHFPQKRSCEILKFYSACARNLLETLFCRRSAKKGRFLLFTNRCTYLSKKMFNATNMYTYESF